MTACCRKKRIWCLLDELFNCRIEWICERHDKVITAR